MHKHIITKHYFADADNYRTTTAVKVQSKLMRLMCCAVLGNLYHILMFPFSSC